ncbi:TrkA-N domain protein [Methanosalsum zhilinae DSM 4017]|uniref:TrkA-N domain protein n=1 Tax=Methanosalsum zhilinae (strain DSM 4017 / NBRC 107636 / OCM 62 / WeN5) TaxID=679901 RepID=F7XKN6_METZD|nr:potassium channel protein [Methanosalsum zhilinae]AEH60645.1 TrkA-N domain protein [Methanosalsum zhilinae DSM 4017]
MEISRFIPKKSIKLYTSVIVSVIILYSFVFLHLTVAEGQIENANLLTAVYWVMTTMTTVGYGDVVLLSDTGKAFSILVQLSGITIVFGILFPQIIIPWIEKAVKTKLPTHVPDDMKHHIVICASTKLVEILIEGLKDQKVSYVVIDDDEQAVRELMKNDIICIYGNPAEEDTLQRAKVQSARFLIANKSDSENANIALTARKISQVEIISMADDISNTKYLRYAGANKVLSPKRLLGLYMGKRAVDPFVNRLTGAIEFLDGVNIVEFPVYPKSPLVGKTLKVANIQKRTGANIVGMLKGGTFSFHPEDSDIITENTVFLATGTTEQLSNLQKLTV